MDVVHLGFSLIGVMVGLAVRGLPFSITLISTGAIDVWLSG